MQAYHDYRLGYQSQNNETPSVTLSVTGNMPTWLNGTLVRNGPAKYDIGDQSFRHWFDGFSMLHKFVLKNGAITYTSKFLKSRAYSDAMQNGKISSNEFATSKNKSILEKVFSVFDPALTDNANVNVSRFGSQYLAMTETAYPILFDLPTLDTIARVDYQDNLKCQLTTAHPHFDFSSNTLINIATSFGPSSNYIVISVDPYTKTRTPICTIPAKSPGYIHSFGMTENYIILVEFPLTVKALELLLGGKPYIENYHWHSDQSTRFFLVNKNGHLIGPIETDPCFAFHHVNAYEQADELIVDLLAYPDSSIVNSLYLGSLLSAEHKLEAPLLHRYRINLSNQSINKELLSSERLELPRINYKSYNSKNYRYTYAIGQSNDGIYLDQLTKLDLSNGNKLCWRQESCLPGEPVFVASPNSAVEDDGILLSVILDAKEQRSFLLILNASNMEEMARAIMPNIMPFGFHGQFFGE